VSLIIAKNGVQEGMVLLFPHHTSAAVYINDSDVTLTADFMVLIGRLVPEGEYKHDRSDPSIKPGRISCPCCPDRT